MKQITFAPTFSAWQKAARRALAEGLTPGEIAWEHLGGGQPALAMFDEHVDCGGGSAAPVQFKVPREFVAMAGRVACHRDERRWAQLYEVLWRLTHGEPKLLAVVVDPAVHELMRMDKAVRHDVHKMRAFVRFSEVQHEGGLWYVAWFEPQHLIMELNSGFFRDRFAQMRWSVLTPERCMHWDGRQLSFTAGVPKSEAPEGDGVEVLWRTYYGHIFNPARVKEKAMLSEMPKRYWKNLPEAAIIPALLNEAPERVRKMRQDSESKLVREEEYQVASPPETADWEVLRGAACACRACPLWKSATQTVFGEGPREAALVIVGEQPGDQEDREGRPFAGPAGKLLDRALEAAGIRRGEVYVTNAVKHFKWEPRGRRRLHQTPDRGNIHACRPWLLAELRLLRPKVLLCLGGTAAASVFGAPVKVMLERGRVMQTPLCGQTVITVHPSMLLRLPDEAAREREFELLVGDLRLAAGCCL